MGFNDGFYYGDEDDVALDKGCLTFYWLQRDGGAITRISQYLASKVSNTNGDSTISSVKTSEAAHENEPRLAKKPSCHGRR